MTIKEFYTGHSTQVIGSIVVIILVLVVGGTIVAPSLFYDQWIWKYYWGPVVADAAGHSVSHNGVAASEGYTLISEITYGVILIAALYAIYKLLKKLKINIDWKFCLALMPYILFGPVTRVLEDAEYFSEPTVYWFISPPIYLQIAVYALLFIIVGYYLLNTEKKQTLWYSIIFLLGVNVFSTLMWTLGTPHALHSVEPLIFYVISCGSLIPLLYVYLKNKSIAINSFLFSGGLLFLLPTLYLTARWIAGEQWASTQGVRFDVFLLIAVLVSIITLGVYLVARRYSKNEKVAVYANPLNLAMIAGHMIDGITSYVSIYDPLKMGLPLYLEKHPASNFLMEVWPPLFPIVKFFLIISVIYLFDTLYKKELHHYRHLANLLKIGILILGFSPGLRDLLRITMGV